ncbi:DUF2235 domain-containing protein [uncultured Roseovarius sp.]|uniref:DUF2235 domain-containing protein n=1 Tax=uncultured Roseovarius sp. TaxID=293344 RepID=UPI002612BD58|nr:DUF2235 domain-containing protein [uncultured Roseovarius sp.]
MSKSIVICCDGTGNEIKEHQSNVLKFFRILEKDERQVAYYDPGVGTISNSGAWAVLKNKAKGVFGLATGYGLDDNVLEAYRFIVKHYQQGDKIYLFGFSRGAYTVRVLAGFMKLIGLLSPEQDNLCGYALTAYKQASEEDDFKIAWRIHRVLQTNYVPIRFMGCWDTVGSVIIPRPDRFYVPSFQVLPYTHSNPSVQTFRHAMAIDERRRMFRLTPWKEPQKFKPNPFIKDDVAEDQDIKQVWFSGVHSDIGGGYPESESGAAKIALKWMMDEAAENGLRFRKKLPNLLVFGENPKNSTWHYAAPNETDDLHESMSWAWKILEYLPKRSHRLEWYARRKVLGFYLPRSEPRDVDVTAQVHPSVYARKAKRDDYDPENLPLEL